MSPNLKLSVYAVLLILCVWFGWAFYSNYSAATRTEAESGVITPVAAPESPWNPNNAADTNSPPQAVAAPAINATASDTNAGVAQATNTTAARSNAPARHRKARTVRAPAPVRDVSSARSAMIAYLAALVLAVIALGLLIAIDVTHFVGSKAIDMLFDAEGEAPKDPEYERAEAEWANGKFLDAVQIMRDFLQKNPRHIHAAVRIAEIYEKDLKNPLAAALEYEEVLKHRFAPERWSWTAIHLCNLYSRLNQHDKALALLRRVADEYPRTKGAKKARAHLGIAEPELEPAEEEASPESESESEGTLEHPVIFMEERPPELEPRDESWKPPTEPHEPPKPPEPPKSKLPPGFRPRQ